MNLPNEIWIVVGSTGEYSDYREWSVAAYTSKEEAEKHVELCKKWFDDNGGIEELRSNYDILNPYDPHMSVDYTGTTWSIFPLILKETVDETLANLKSL